VIARTWRGATRAADAERYTAYLHATGIAAFRSTPGNTGSHVLRRIAGDRAEFVVLSFWEDEAAVRRFAGEDPGRAVFFPADDAFLVERDLGVDHWDVA
jgi:heme-degrading monooxygenase HmoA